MFETINYLNNPVVHIHSTTKISISQHRVKKKKKKKTHLHGLKSINRIILKPYDPYLYSSLNHIPTHPNLSYSTIHLLFSSVFLSFLVLWCQKKRGINHEYKKPK